MISSRHQKKKKLQILYNITQNILRDLSKRKSCLASFFIIKYHSYSFLTLFNLLDMFFKQLFKTLRKRKVLCKIQRNIFMYFSMLVIWTKVPTISPRKDGIV